MGHEDNTIKLLDPTGKDASYSYDKVYGPDDTQEALYTDAVHPIVDQVTRGMACAIFAYGQTGAGKTFTMRGDLSDDVSKYGIIQRSVTDLFEKLAQKAYSDVKLSCSFLEVYNEELEDLLVDPPKKSDLSTPSSKRPAKTRLT